MPDSLDATRLKITRTFAAPPQRVFDAWVDPVQRMAWWSAEPGLKCDVCEIDPRVGGTYRVNMKTADQSKEFITVGEFLEFDPPSRLVFTWSWENPDDPVQNTKVTIDFRPVADGTELTLVHEGFTTAPLRDDHSHGWHGCFDSLAKFVTAHP